MFVSYLEETKKSLAQLTVEEFVAINPLFGPDVTTLWNFTQSVDHRHAIGGTSLSAVKEQITQMKRWLQAAKK